MDSPNIANEVFELTNFVDSCLAIFEDFLIRRIFI